MNEADQKEVQDQVMSEDRDIFLKKWESILREFESSVAEANRVELAIISTLITLALLLFTFTSPLLGIDIGELRSWEKVVLIVSWVSLFFSTCFGSFQLIHIFHFHAEWVSKKREMLKVLNQVEFNNPDDRYRAGLAVNAIGSIGAAQSLIVYWKLQGFFLIVSFGAIILVASHLLFR